MSINRNIYTQSYFLKLIVFTLLQVLVNNQNSDGCLQRNSKLQCIQCEDGYILNSNNLCVYQNCKYGFFLQNKLDQSSNQNLNNQSCVAICDKNFYHNQFQNICSKFQPCSLSFKTQTNLNQGDQITAIYSYQSQYILIFHSLILLQMNRASGIFEQSLQIDNNIIEYEVFNDQLIVMSLKDQTIRNWDISTNKFQSLCFFSQLRDIIDKLELINVNDQIIISIGLYYEILTISIQSHLIYPALSPIITNQQLKIVFGVSEIIQWYSNIIVRFLSNSVRITEIYSNNQYQISLNEFTQSKFICSLQGNFIQLKKLKNSNLFVAISQASMQLIVISQSDCVSQTLPDIIIKFDLIYIQNIEYIIVLTNSSLIILDQSFIVSKSFSLNNYQEIDMTQSLQSQNNYQIYILVNEQSTKRQFTLQLNVQFQSNQFIINQAQVYNVGISEAKYLSYFPQTKDGNFGQRLIIFGIDYQSIQLDSLAASSQQEKSDYLVENFSLGLPQINNQIQSVLILDQIQILLASNSKGNLYVWDFSSIFNAQFICSIILPSSFNNQIIGFDTTNQETVLIITSFHVLIFSTYSCQIIKQWGFESNNQSNALQASVYQDQIIILIQNQLFLMQQSDLNTLQALSVQFTGIINSISYQQDSNIIIQINSNTLIQSKLDRTQFSIQQINGSTFQDSIQLFRIKNYSINEQQQYQIPFEIIVYTNGQKVYFLKNDLTEFSQVQDIQIQKAIDLNFINDASDNAYVIGGLTSKKSTQFLYEAYIIFKDTKSVQLAYQVSAMNQLFPTVKFYDPLAQSTIYRLRMGQSFGIIQTIGGFDYDISRQVNTFQNLLIANNIINAAVTLTKDKKYSLIGDSVGTIATKVYELDPYTSLYQLDQTSINKSQFIQKVYQSYLLGVALIIKNTIEIFNINTNEFIKSLQFKFQQEDPILQFYVLEQQQKIVACKQYTIMVYDFISDQTIFFDNGSSSISNILIYNDPNSNSSIKIISYGQLIQQFDLSLQIQKQFSLDQSALNCLIAEDSLICKLYNRQMAIFSLSKNSISYQFKPKYQNDYIFGVDDIYQSLIICSLDVNLYSIKGNFKQKLLTSLLQINDLKFFGSRIIIVCQRYLQVFDRVSFSFLATITPGGGTANIIKLIYVEPSNHLISTTDIVRFGQAFLYSLDTFNLIQSLKESYTQNNPLMVCDLFYDYFQNYLVLFDIAGNIGVWDYFSGAYTSITFILIKEFFYNAAYSPIGLSFNPSTNNLLLYSKVQVFQYNYAQLLNKYSIHTLKQNNYFVELPQLSSSNDIQLLILGVNSKLFLYSSFQFQYFSRVTNWTDCIKDIQILQDQQLLILGFTNQFQIYQASIDSFQLSLNIKNQNSQNQVTGYKLRFFLANNLFYTIDKKIIHYDFYKNKELKVISLSNNQWITCYQYIESLGWLVIGLNDGTAFIYQISNQAKIDFNLQNSKTSQNAVKFIVETQSFIWMSTQQTILVKIDKKNIFNSVQYDLSQFNNQSKKLNAFFADERVSSISSINYNNRIFISYLGEKLIRGIDISTLQTQNFKIKQLQFPNHSNNKILLTENQIIFYTTFQLNIHQRDTLDYIMSIKRQNLMDEIVDIRVFNDGMYYFIVFQYKFEFIKVDFSQMSFQLLDQITISNLLIAKTIFDMPNQKLRVIGVSQDTLFDQQYSLGYYSDQSTFGYYQCSLDIQSISSLQMAQTIGLIKPPSVQLPSFIGIQSILNSTQNNFYTLYLESNNLQDINFDVTKDAQITMLPLSQKTSDNFQSETYYNSQILITPTTFVNISKKDILIKAFQFRFFQQENFLMPLKFNNISKNIYFQNILVQSQKLQDVNFYFQNMTVVALMNITLYNMTIKFNSNNSNNQFFFFSDCSYVYIYNMIINNSTFIGELNSFINAQSVQNLEINNLEITDSYLDFFFISQNVANLTINNIKITNCAQTQKIQQLGSIYFFQSLGTLNLQINNIIYGNNSNVQFLNSQKQLQSNDYTITLNSDILTMIKANFYNNTNMLGNYQSTEQHLINIYSTNVIIQNLDFYNNQGNVFVTKANNVTFQQCNFTQNHNLNGGGIELDTVYVGLKILTSVFVQNRVTGSGGGIYINNQIKDFQLDDQSVITQNTALIGGGIRFFLNTDSKANGQFSSFYNRVNLKSNNALIYGQDIALNLKSIRVKSVIQDPSGQNNPVPFNFHDPTELSPQEQQIYSGKLVLQNIASGSSFKISLAVLDQIGDVLYFDTSLLRDKSYPPDIQQELSSIFFKLDTLNTSNQVLISGETYITPDQFNQTEFAFNFREFQMTSSPLLQIQFNLEYSISTVESKPILVVVTFRQCIVGEIYKYFSQQIISCYQCPEGQFSLVQPSITQQGTKNVGEDVQACQKCPDSASYCSGSSIVLKDGYWRNDDNSSSIFYCLNQPNNCVSQIRSDVDQIKGCVRGNIGPLCEECDYFGDIWKGFQYSNSFTQRYNCSECSDTSYQIAFIVIMSLFFTLYLFFSTLMFMSSFMHTQTCYYLRRLNLFPISSNSIRDQSSFYLKIILNYLQISSMLIYFKLNVFPSFFGDLGNLFQSPSNKINVTINCSIISIVNSRLRKVQVQQIIQFLTPIFFYVIIKFSFSICEKLKKYNINNQYKYTLYNLVFAFFQPSSIQFYSQSLSCRQIGQNYYSQFDLLIKCDDLRKNSFSQPFCITMILFWILAPLWKLYRLKQNSQLLNNCIIRYRYGFYYSEFKKNFYYWEFIRSNLRISLVLLFTFLSGDNIYLVYIEIIFIMSLYIKLLLNYRPIQSNKLLEFEILSIFVIIVNLLLTALNREYNYVAIESITYAIHICFVAYTIIVIISYKVSSNLNAFGRLIRWIFKKMLPQKFYQKFITKNQIRFSTYQKWKLIKSLIPFIIGLKALENAKEISNTINKTNFLSKSNKRSQVQKQISQLVADVSRSFSPKFNYKIQGQKQDQTFELKQQEIERSQFSQIDQIDEKDIDKSDQKNGKNSNKLKESNYDMSMSLSKIQFFSNLENIEKATDSQSQNEQSPQPQIKTKGKRLLPSQYQMNPVNISSLYNKDKSIDNNS